MCKKYPSLIQLFGISPEAAPKATTAFCKARLVTRTPVGPFPEHAILGGGGGVAGDGTVGLCDPKCRKTINEQIRQVCKQASTYQ